MSELDMIGIAARTGVYEDSAEDFWESPRTIERTSIHSADALIDKYGFNPGIPKIGKAEVLGWFEKVLPLYGMVELACFLIRTVPRPCFEPWIYNRLFDISQKFRIVGTLNG